MDWIPQIFRRRKIYNDLSEEIRLHIEERTEQLVREGMSPKQAEREARLAFGNRMLLEERSREVWQWPTLESIAADVRLALRQLRTFSRIHHRRCFDAGIGNRGKRRGLWHLGRADPAPAQCAPAAEPLRNRARATRSECSPIPTISTCATATAASRTVALNTVLGLGLDTGKNPSQVMGYEVSGNYFDALRIQPYLGRFFHGVR